MDAEHPEVVLEAAAVAVASVFVEAGSAAEAVLAAVGVAASGVAAAVEVVAVASEEGEEGSEVAKFGRDGSFCIEKMLPVLPGSPFCFYFCAPLFSKSGFLYTKKNSCFEIHQMNRSLFLLVLWFHICAQQRYFVGKSSLDVLNLSYFFWSTNKLNLSNYEP